MPSADLTRRELSLGARDSVIGWCAKSFAETTIEGSIQNAGSDKIGAYLQVYSKYPHTAYIPDVIHLGDELIDDQGYYYAVRSAEQIWRLNEFICYKCQTEKIEPHTDRAATSGTWHLDAAALKTDSRYRHKLYFDTYIADTYLDNGVIAAAGVFMFAGVDYPILYELHPDWEDNDYVVAVDKSTLKPHADKYHKAYKFTETASMTIYTMNKTGLTAVNLLDQVEEAIKETVTDYPLGSIRRIDRIDNKPLDMGGFTIYSSTVTLVYDRVNDDHTPTYPIITYGDSQASNYIFPNVLNIQISDPDTGDIRLMPPGRMGNILEILGSEDFEITLTCDLDMAPALLTWERPQATTPKTDTVPWQVFAEIKFGGKTDADQVYQNLYIGTTAIPVRLASYNTELMDEMNLLTVKFRRYSATDGSGGTYKTWNGIT